MTEHNTGDTGHDSAAAGAAGSSGSTPLLPAVPPPSSPATYPGAGYPEAPGAYPALPAPRTNTLAIVSLVTGFCCAVAAVITGHIALGQIKRTGEAGRGLAIAGLVLGYVGIGFTALTVVVAMIFAVTLGVFVAAVSGTTSSSSSSASTGQVGAAYLDDGYLQVGTGETVVDLYIDPMCPYCGQFDATNGDTLAAFVGNESITLRLHSLTFLDQASQGSEYSSRASSALTCEAAINPDSTLDYLSALFANQPTEGTTGLTDDQLIALSSGDSSIAECVSDEEYVAWSQQNTDEALNSPLPGSDQSSLQGTPTVLVDGSQYLGAIDDAQAFADFVLGATA